MLTLVKDLWREEDGQGLAEYGLILGLVAIMLIGAVVAFRDQLDAIFNKITEDLGTKSGTSTSSGT